MEENDEESITMEDLAELLPENTPRYIVLSFEVRSRDFDSLDRLLTSAPQFRSTQLFSSYLYS